MRKVALRWPSYRLLPYEQSFALAEVRSLLAPQRIAEREHAVDVDTDQPESARHLTYFQTFQVGTCDPEPTTQHLIESETSGGARRQSTRYSVHGLHEYKGKFNPQVARALLTAAGLPRGASIFDPFCGSGTTLVECAHAGLRGVGMDVNPLAALLANAKIQALSLEPPDIISAAEEAVRAAHRQRAIAATGERGAYLTRWFDAGMLARLEALRVQVERRGRQAVRPLLAVASNLLREFSLQEPEDLRIRRRTSPPSNRDPYDVFLEHARALASNVEVVQRHIGRKYPRVVAHHADTRCSAGHVRPRGGFHAAITSPPYAMALPYIDTQRLSLVWLGLVEPRNLPSLQAELIGSREFNGSPRGAWEEKLAGNGGLLPARQATLCRQVLGMVGPGDGFRRHAVPALLYRYLVGMRESFAAVRSVLRPGAPFFLIVGHNHTVLGGQRFDIDTPALLAELGESSGFGVEGREVLQTYQRYGLHQRNSIDREELLTLRAR